MITTHELKNMQKRAINAWVEIETGNDPKVIESLVEQVEADKKFMENIGVDPENFHVECVKYAQSQVLAAQLQYA